MNDDNNGLLYNWYAVNSGKLCPDGFHVPSDYDWNILRDYLGNSPGGKLKQKGYKHWKQPNTNATDMYGFNSIPTWLRVYHGEYVKDDIGSYQSACYWSSSQSANNVFQMAYMVWIQYNDDSLLSNETFYNQGFAVRCIKDE